VEVKDYEEVRDIREELLQVLRLLQEEDLSLLLEVMGVVLLQEVVPEAVEDEQKEKEGIQPEEEVH
jgi:hypothetical protein